MGHYPLGAGSEIVRRRNVGLVFQDESAISLTPPGRRTWAPRGETPVIHAPLDCKRCSMAALLAWALDGSRATVTFSVEPGTDNDLSVIAFIRQLRRPCHANKVTLV